MVAHTNKLVKLCGWCNRDLPGRGAQNEQLRQQDPEARVSHGICPGCREKVEREAEEACVRREATQPRE